MTKRFLLAYINKDGEQTLRVIEPSRISFEINKTLLPDARKKFFRNKVTKEKLAFYRFKDSSTGDVIEFDDLEKDYVTSVISGINYETSFTEWWSLIDNTNDDEDARIRLCVRLNEMFETADYAGRDRYAIIYLDEKGQKCLRVSTYTAMSSAVTEETQPEIFQKEIYQILDTKSIAVHLVKPGVESFIRMSDIKPSVTVLPFESFKSNEILPAWKILNQFDKEDNEAEEFYAYLKDRTVLLNLGDN